MKIKEKEKAKSIVSYVLFLLRKYEWICNDVHMQNILGIKFHAHLSTKHCLILKILDMISISSVKIFDDEKYTLTYSIQCPSHGMHIA